MKINELIIIIIPRPNRIHLPKPIRVFCRSPKIRNVCRPNSHFHTGSSRTISAVPTVLVSSSHLNGCRPGHLQLKPRKQRSSTCSYLGRIPVQWTGTCTILLGRRSFSAGLEDPKNRCSGILFPNVHDRCQNCFTLCR